MAWIGYVENGGNTMFGLEVPVNAGAVAGTLGLALIAAITFWLRRDSGPA